MTPLKAGDELFTFYGYGPSAPFPSDFPWYWETKTSIEKQERLEREEQKRLMAEKANLAKESKAKKRNKKSAGKKKGDNRK